MKTMSWIKSFFLATLITTSAVPVFAGQEGHGGDGLLVNGTPYLLDLLEAGVEENPFYNEKVETNRFIHEALSRSIPHLSSATERLAKKLSEIYEVSPRMAWALTYSFDFYDFRLVSPSLVDIPDEDTVIDYDPKYLVQLAIRRGAAVLIDRDNWAKLNPDNQAALLLHEMVYALANVEKIDKFMGYNSQGEPVLVKVNGQVSAPARALVGYLYTQGFVDGNYRSRLASLLTRSQLSEISGSMEFPIKTAIKTKEGYIFSNQRYNVQVQVGSQISTVEIGKDTTDDEIIKSCQAINNQIAARTYSDGRFTLEDKNFQIRYDSSNSGLLIWDTIEGLSIRPMNAQGASECLKSLKDVQSRIHEGETLGR